MITESDRQIYQEYKDDHDGTMGKFIEWFERGGRPETNRLPQQQKRVYRHAYNRIRNLNKEMTGADIARKFNISSMDVYRLLKKQYRKVNINKAKEIIK